ncbi:MAG: serine/threonine-protein kinase [Sandaracinaceae bacterium]
MFSVGDVIGTYTILAHLRSGGMADLFLARREGAAGFRRLVAIKVVHPSLAEDRQLVDMFLDEARITARIDHPNVVHVEDLGMIGETYFLVMEYVHGCSLSQMMKVLGQQQRRLSPIVAVAIAARVAEGLHAAHETTDEQGAMVGLVHRDVSPQNILLSHKGHVKLIDFGVAKASVRSQQTQLGMLKGKVRYMAPEQATSADVDPRTDVYSLGIVLWEMLTMRRLFAGKTEFEILMAVRDPEIPPPSHYVQGLPRELDEVVLCALAKDPAARPPSAKTLRRMLAAALPSSMALDSAHLAELMATVVGVELQQVRHELPEEVSRLLEAEALLSMRAEDEASMPSIVDSMTVHSDLVSFELDELDQTGPTGLSQIEPPTVVQTGEPSTDERHLGSVSLATEPIDDGTLDFEMPPDMDGEATMIGVHDDLDARAHDIERPEATEPKTNISISPPPYASMMEETHVPARPKPPSMLPWAIAAGAAALFGVTVSVAGAFAIRSCVAEPADPVEIATPARRKPIVQEPTIIEIQLDAGAADAGPPPPRRRSRRTR